MIQEYKIPMSDFANESAIFLINRGALHPGNFFHADYYDFTPFRIFIMYPSTS
jgi:hypothetical protein